MAEHAQGESQYSSQRMNGVWKLTALGAFYLFVILMEIALDNDAGNNKDKAMDVITTKQTRTSENHRKEVRLRKLFQEKQRDLLNTCRAYAQSFEDPSSSSGEFFSSTDPRFNQKVKLKSFLINEKRKTMYCWNRKVASSFWTWTISKASGARNDTPFTKPYKISSKMSPRSLSSYHTAVSSYQNIILVRHPMARLISAYRDRVAGLKGSYTFYRTVAKFLQITRKDKKVQYSTHKALPGSNKTIPVTYWKKIFVPTWPEFVKYLLKTNTCEDVSFIILFCSDHIYVSTFRTLTGNCTQSIAVHVYPTSLTSYT